MEPETWLRHVISVINTWPANCSGTVNLAT
ncbi:TPA: hypothetical protein ACYSBS_005000 [Escherichia coli]|nr:hypothetical protein [Escherichia coli]MCN5352009.1 hypothetical protein [Escherichia coli]MCN8932827.1 hypothetical protein [Escherichia coli]MCW6986144.1 hypothetical protein [Escherichia coli]